MKKLLLIVFIVISACSARIAHDNIGNTFDVYDNSIINEKGQLVNFTQTSKDTWVDSNGDTYTFLDNKKQTILVNGKYIYKVSEYDKNIIEYVGKY